MTALATPMPTTSNARRILLAAVGIVSVGVGAIGVVVPGLPTGIFLVFASWCFARSWPALEAKLVRRPIFRPFLYPFESGAAMPIQARIICLLCMWLAISWSIFLVGTPWFTKCMLAAGAAGSLCIVFIGRKARVAAPVVAA